MRYEATNKRIYKDTFGILRINKWLMLLCAVVLSLNVEITIVQAQVELSPITMNVGNSAYAKTQATGQSDIRNITSSVPAVATGVEWGTNDVKISGKSPGVTVIRFFDRSTGTNYRVTVTVNAKPVNQPAGGGNEGGNAGDNQGGGGNNGGGNLKPKKIEDFTPFGKPERKPLPEEGYKEIIKNKDGQIVQEKQYDKNGKLIRTKNIEEVYSKNNPAKESYITGEDKVGSTEKVEDIYYNQEGKIVKLETYTEPNEFGQMTKKEVWDNGKTTIYKRDPKTDKWVPTDENKQVGNNKGKVEGKIDRCMVGTWRSESVTNKFIHWDNGGSGIILTIKADGKVTVDYSKMQPNVKPNETISWGGTAAGQIAIGGDGNVTVVSVEESNLTSKYVRPGNNNYDGKMQGLGNILQSTSTYGYACDETTLKFTSNAYSSAFKKIE